MRYAEDEITSTTRNERRNPEMERRTVFMRHKQKDFFWHGFTQKLCPALLCSDMTREKDR